MIAGSSDLPTTTRNLQFFPIFKIFCRSEIIFVAPGILGHNRELQGLQKRPIKKFFYDHVLAQSDVKVGLKSIVFWIKNVTYKQGTNNSALYI